MRFIVRVVVNAFAIWVVTLLPALALLLADRKEARAGAVPA